MNARHEHLLSPHAAVVDYFDTLLNGASADAESHQIFRLAHMSVGVPRAALEAQFNATAVHGARIKGWLGWLVHGGRELAVADSAFHLLSADHAVAFNRAEACAVVLRGCDIALAFDGTSGMAEFAAEDICSRSERTVRPWLSGTVRSRRCVLLDPAGVADFLERALTRVHEGGK